MTLALDRSGPCRFCGATTNNREFVAWMRDDWVCPDSDFEECLERLTLNLTIGTPDAPQEDGRDD